MKSLVDKIARQEYQNYINNVLEATDEFNRKQQKLEKFWSYIKSLRQDNNGIPPLKHNGRLMKQKTKPI